MSGRTAHMAMEPFHLKLAARAIMRELDRGTLDDIATDRDQVAAFAGFLDAIRLGEFANVDIRVVSDGVPEFPGEVRDLPATAVELASRAA